MKACIYYCGRLADGEEHWLPRAFGAIRDLQLLKDRICTICNNELGTLDQEVSRTGPTGVLKSVLGIEGRHKTSANPFHYRVMGPESATTLMMPLEDGREVLGQNYKSPSGEIQARALRQLVFEKTEGDTVCVPFPPGYDSARLKSLLVERSAQDAALKEVYLDPGESGDDPAIIDAIRAAVKSPFHADVYTQGTDGSRRGVKLALGISRAYVRGLAKIGFHYYLANASSHRGDEFLFQPIRDFIKHDTGDWQSFVRMEIPHFIGQLAQGQSPEHFGHFLSADRQQGEIVARLQFFVGPAHVFPPSGVRLGISSHEIPRALHWVKYFNAKQDGYAGELIDLLVGDRVERSLDRTGLVCPSCKAPVGVIENSALGAMVMSCPACGHRWSAEEPREPQH